MKLTRLEKSEIVTFIIAIFIVSAIVIYFLPTHKKPVEAPKGLYTLYKDSDLDQLKNCKRKTECDKIAEKLRAKGLIQ